MNHKVHRGKAVGVYSKRQIDRGRCGLAQARVLRVFDHPDYLAILRCGLADIHVAIGLAQALPDRG